jgi:hypothetical protein
VKAQINVMDEEEARLIREGLKDPATRALVKMMGALLPLKNDEARARVLTEVCNELDVKL